MLNLVHSIKGDTPNTSALALAAPAEDTADQPHAGGIGMKVLAALVTQLDGRISAYSNPVGHRAGAGTCFMVTFPMA